MKTKRCRQCLQVLDRKAFARSPLTSDGRRSECNLCRMERRSELREGAPRRKPWSMAGVFA